MIAYIIIIIYVIQYIDPLLFLTTKGIHIKLVTIMKNKIGREQNSELSFYNLC